MSNTPFNEHEVHNVTPEHMRKELDKYIEHVQQYDPKSIEFALMITGHGNKDGGTHVCSMVGGPPEALAQVVVVLMNEMIDRNPSLAVFFLLNSLQRLRDQQKTKEADDTGGPDVEAQVKDLIGKMNRSIH